MSTEYDLIAHRKWALEFLAKLNPGKPFDGDVFADADALVAYVTNGRPAMVQQPAATMAGIDPFNVNAGLAV